MDTIDPTEAPVADTPVGHEGVRLDIEERPAWHGPGLVAILLLLASIGGLAYFLIRMIKAGEGNEAPLDIVMMFAMMLLLAVMITSFTVVSPGNTHLVQFFGTYKGTIRQPGLWMVQPLSSRKKVSIKVRNFETETLKVNDSDGNPINIAAIIVWQVADTAKAHYAVEDYEDFVTVQAESALRHVASIHPYDNAGPGQPTLRGSTELIASQLAAEVADRIFLAGLEVIEARISTLAYAQEIAHAMLQRQQASAVIAAREMIVEGAVTMVQTALDKLDREDIVQLDEERKAAMVSNLLVVLCSDSHATPVVNAGSLY